MSSPCAGWATLVAKTNELRGNLQGNGSDPSTLFVHAPEGMQPGNATLDGNAAAVRLPQARVLAVDVPALAEPAAFVLTFKTHPGDLRGYQLYLWKKRGVFQTTVSRHYGPGNSILATPIFSELELTEDEIAKLSSCRPT